MRLPRDIGGEELVKRLARLGYEMSYQSGSHIRLTHKADGEHRITVPRHRELKVGTLGGIVKDVAEHLKVDRAELLRGLFG